MGQLLPPPPPRRFPGSEIPSWLIIKQPQGSSRRGVRMRLLPVALAMVLLMGNLVPGGGE